MLQAQRIGTPPSDSSLRVDTFKIADHHHAEINAGCDAGSADGFALVEMPTFLLDECIESFSFKNLVYRIVENMATCTRQLLRRYPHGALPLTSSTHRHWFFSYSDIIHALRSESVLLGIGKATSTTGC